MTDDFKPLRIVVTNPNDNSVVDVTAAAAIIYAIHADHQEGTDMIAMGVGTDRELILMIGQALAEIRRRLGPGGVMAAILASKIDMARNQNLRPKKPDGEPETR